MDIKGNLSGWWIIFLLANIFSHWMPSPSIGLLFIDYVWSPLFSTYLLFISAGSFLKQKSDTKCAWFVSFKGFTLQPLHFLSLYPVFVPVECLCRTLECNPRWRKHTFLPITFYQPYHQSSGGWLEMIVRCEFIWIEGTSIGIYSEIQPLIQWVPGIFRGLSSRNLALTTHPHIVNVKR